jgi:hypothetical protein
VKTDIQTLSHSGGSSDVPSLYVKTQDANNIIYALIRTTGVVALTMLYGGGSTTWPNVTDTVDPDAAHVLTVSVIGTNAKVWVDSTLYLNIDNAYFDNIAGYVGLYTPSSTGEFDNVVIID